MHRQIDITAANPQDAIAIAEIHIAARRQAMPYLNRVHTDDETRAWFTHTVTDRPSDWWVARYDGHIVGYMYLENEDLHHLYVLPERQRHGVGQSLLDKAKTLSPRRLALSAFQRNLNARAFYEANGFRATGCTDGRNEEHEPDVQYQWLSTAQTTPA